MKLNILLISVFLLILSIGCKKDESSDSYPSVTIGNQIWMKNNLDVDHYKNGDAIPQITDSTEWAKATSGAWCYYENNSANGTIYGKLYNWYAVNDSRGLAPTGWHVASETEWTTLSTTLGGETVSGGKLKETGTSHWISPNTGASNSNNFTALPGGYRNLNGRFTMIGNSGKWWTSTLKVDPTPEIIEIKSLYASMFYYPDDKKKGYSVRCVKD